MKSSAAAVGSFAPTFQYGKPEIHTVFLGFPYFNSSQNLSPAALADFTRASLGNGKVRITAFGSKRA